MFALAVTLIVLGLLMILYYILSDARPAEESGPAADSPERGAAESEPVGFPGASRRGSSDSGDRGARSSSSGREPTSSGRSPGFPSGGAGVAEGPGGQTSREPASNLDGETLYQRLDSESLGEALRGRRNRRPAGPPPLAMEGILFLKPDRLPSRPDLLQAGEGSLASVRRVGPANLFAEGGRFLLRAGDASFTYSANDLEEIRFEQGGFAFIPVDRARPVPVFLTERQDELKSFLRTHTESGAR